VRAGALGDLLLMRRAIAGLKALGHRVSLMAPAAHARALLGPGLSEVDAVLDWGDPAFLPLLASEDSPEPELAARFAAFGACIAYTRQEQLVERLARHIKAVIPQPPEPLEVHAAEWLARPARALGAKPPAVPPDLEATEPEAAQAEAFLQDRLAPGFLAVHPGSGGSAKNWPGFAALVEGLGGQPWVLVEGPADAAAVAGLATSGPRVPARNLPLRTLGPILGRAGLFVGNDSGVTHLAAAWGAPTLALFGPTDPATWSPVGRRVTVARSASASLADLPVAEVLRTARALWKRGPDRSPSSLR
jgi:hypothetical protein